MKHIRYILSKIYVLVIGLMLVAAIPTVISIVSKDIVFGWLLSLLYYAVCIIFVVGGVIDFSTLFIKPDDKDPANYDYLVIKIEYNKRYSEDINHKVFIVRDELYKILPYDSSIEISLLSEEKPDQDENKNI